MLSFFFQTLAQKSILHPNLQKEIGKGLFNYEPVSANLKAKAYYSLLGTYCMIILT